MVEVIPRIRLYTATSADRDRDDEDIPTSPMTAVSIGEVRRIGWCGTVFLGKVLTGRLRRPTFSTQDEMSRPVSCFRFQTETVDVNDFFPAP